MENKMALRRRLDEISDEVYKAQAARDDGRLSEARFKGLVGQRHAEVQSIKSQLETHQHANRVMGAQEAAMGGNVNTKAFGLGSGPKPASPMDLTQVQVKALWAAANARTPFSVDVGQQGLESMFMGGVSTKAASPALESGIGGGFTGNLPPVQTMYAVGLGYETTRIASLLPGAAMPGPSATWLTHATNTAEAGAVAEGAAKPFMGPTFTENQVKPQKLAGIVEFSLEAWQDTSTYGEGSFSAWLPQELTRSLINTESNFLLNAGTDSGPTATFDGLLAVSGTMTRAVGTDTPLDALSEAYADLRSGGAYGEPDLVIMSPKTMNALRREKSASGRYILDMLAGPLSLTSDGQRPVIEPADEPNAHSIVPQGAPPLSGLLWGAPVALTTQVADGTALVMNLAGGAGIFWQRLGLRIEFNMYSDSLWQNNLYAFRAEERIALSVPRPEAINIVTGLPS